jgi:signal transduction histidine kinase
MILISSADDIPYNRVHIPILFASPTHAVSIINIIPAYPTEFARLSDTYTGLIIVIGFFSILVVYAKNNLLKQYELAKRADKLKSAFLANMSHEIRTPLNAIVGFSQLLTKRELTKEKKEQFSQIINDNSKYLHNLISDILDISLIESGQLKTIFNNCNLNDLLNKIFVTHERLLKESGKKEVKLKLKIPANTLEIFIDALRLEQIISNFITNAIKFTAKGQINLGYYTYMPDNEPIPELFTSEMINKLNIKHSKKLLLLYVEDTGAGVKEELQADIFNRFVKNDEMAEKRFERGAGIGLALSKDLSILLGGDINFTSKYGFGSIFYFVLPLND